MKRGLDKRGEASDAMEHMVGIFLQIALGLAFLAVIIYFVISKFGGIQ